MGQYRTIWISDVHLGTRECQAEKLLSFLKNNDAEYLFLVGDIIDFWALKRSPYWPQPHNTVIQKVLRAARYGTKVFYIPGNHDEGLRSYVGMVFGNISLHRDYVHTLANGRKILCVHGDDYDVVTRYHKWTAKLGDVGYSFLLWANRHYNTIRSKFGMRFWSLAAYVKFKVKEAVSFIGDYENNVIKEARSKGVDGVLCGHIHHAEIREVEGFQYLNTGDWVESCTAIVEHHDGRLELIQWTDDAKEPTDNA